MSWLKLLSISKAGVLLMWNHCLLMLPLFVEVLCKVLVLLCSILVYFLVLQLSH